MISTEARDIFFLSFLLEQSKRVCSASVFHLLAVLSVVVSVAPAAI